MRNGPKLTAMVAALLIPLTMAQAAPLQVQSFEGPALIDVQPTTPTIQIPNNFNPVETPTETGGTFKPRLIDGARDEARVDFSEQGERSNDERPGLQTRQFEMQVALSCKISGDDLIIANVGGDVLAAGSTVKWQIKGAGQKGYLAMKSDVLPGKGFKARDVLEGGAKGERCSARGV